LKVISGRPTIDGFIQRSLKVTRNRLDFLSETAKARYIYFETKIVGHSITAR